MDDDHSSSPVIADGIKQPTRKCVERAVRSSTLLALGVVTSLFGLAPCGVLPAVRVATNAVRSYRTFSPLPACVRFRQRLRRTRRRLCIFCATVLRVAPTGRYPAHCPAEFGLSFHLRALRHDERVAQGDNHSSSPAITGGIKQPTRKLRTGRPVTLPYLALLRAGFCLPPVLPRARCALTAPFHHCLPALRRTSAVYFLCHFPSSCPDRGLPGALPSGVRTFLPPSCPASASHAAKGLPGQTHDTERPAAPTPARAEAGNGEKVR
jgi:hypothetical protein